MTNQSSQRNVVLEELIVASPSDDAIKLVYGDWLQERGNPWGELIALQGSKPFEQTSLFEWDDPGAPFESTGDLGPRTWIEEVGNREQALRAQFLVECFGDGILESPPQVRWKCGFVDGVFIPQRSSIERLETSLIDLLEHPMTMTLNELVLGMLAWSRESARGYDAEIEVLAVLAPPTLRRLVLGAWEDWSPSWAGISELTELYPSLTGLESLELQAGLIDLGVIELPSLTNLLVRSGGLSEQAIVSLQRARCPKLESLTIWFGTERYGGCVSVDVAAPFLTVGQFPKLETLGLANAEFADALCELLPHAAILPQLKVLDLSLGTMSADGAQILLENRQRFAHLDQLNLSSNSIPASMHQELSTLCPNVDLRFQKLTRGRYVTVAE